MSPQQSRCWPLCKANCEFVTVMVVCLALWTACLVLYLRCELGRGGAGPGGGALPSVLGSTRQSRNNSSLPGYFPLAPGKAAPINIH